MKNKFSIALSLTLIMALLVSGTVLALSYDSGDKVTVGEHTLNWTGQGVTNGMLDTEICPSIDALPEGIDPESYLHFIFTTDGGSAYADATTPTLTLGGSGSGSHLWFKKNSQDSQFHFYVPYSDLTTLTAYVTFGTNNTGNGAWILTISHGCAGMDYEELVVTKTAETSFTREYFWDITKKVETEDGWMHEGFNKVWLYTDGSGDETATWTVDVTYEGYEDSAWNVAGDITIENTGTLDAVITAVDDVLAGAPIMVECGVTFPYTLMVGETLTCTYDEDVYVEGFNEVTVTTERDTYFDDAEIMWGDPANEVNKTINIKDISDLFGEVDLGMVTAPDDATFTYIKDFAWADYGRTLCGDYTYENEAMIVETEQSASATLKVNVQCMIFKGETAWAANGSVPLEFRYTNKGNWATYVQYAEKCTTLFAGQTIPVGKVCFSAVSGGKVTIKVKMTAPWEYEDVSQNLKVQGYATAPKGNPAPGLFANKKTCDSTLNWCKIAVPANNFYGVHVNVGKWMPDPSFGP